MVENKRTYKGKGVYIGRPSAFGNPFVIGRDGTREQVVEQYRDWFYQQAQTDLRKMAARLLTGKTLICWCAPEACHGDVIEEFLRSCEEEG